MPIESYFSSFFLFLLVSGLGLLFLSLSFGLRFWLCSVFGAIWFQSQMRFGFVVFLVLFDFSSFGLWL